MPKYFFLLGFCLSLMACPATTKLDTSQLDFIDQAATVRVQVATRGSYQYLLEIPQPGSTSLRCMPNLLPVALQKDGQAVLFSGKLLSDSTMIMKPGPTDIPEPDFMVPNVAIETIEAG
jgi:hypothetical protein